MTRCEVRGIHPKTDDGHTFGGRLPGFQAGDYATGVRYVSSSVGSSTFGEWMRRKDSAQVGADGSPVACQRQTILHGGDRGYRGLTKRVSKVKYRRRPVDHRPQEPMYAALHIRPSTRSPDTVHCS